MAGPTNAFAQVFAHEARADAELDREGPLAGVAIAVKDLFDVRGHPTTGCCAAIPPIPRNATRRSSPASEMPARS